MRLTSVDLPEPDTPVTTVITLSGNFTLTFLRLFSRAPVSSNALRQGRRDVGHGHLHFAAQVLAGVGAGVSEHSRDKCPGT